MTTDQAPHRPWHEVLTIGDLLARAVHTAPDREVLVSPHERCTYRELDRRARVVARALRGLGVGPGDHVGLLAPNSVEFLEGLFGATLIGAVVVPLNVRHRSQELAYIAEHARLVALLTTNGVDEHVDLAEVLAEALPSLAEAPDLRALRLPEAPFLRAVALLRGSGKAGCLDDAEVERLAADVPDEDVERCRLGVCVRDLALILYTSGTTAHPKGCMLSHEALTRGPSWRAVHRFVTGAEAERYWIPGPLFHVGALSPFLGCVAAAGTVLTDVYVDAERTLRLLEEEQPTSGWPWFPAITAALLDHPSFDPRRLGSLRFLGQIGPPPVFDRIREALPDVEIFKSSGMTEAAGSFGLSERDDGFEDRVHAQGVPVPGVEVRIIDPETGEDRPRGEAGELLIRGYCVMEGYYRDAETTARAIDADGWLRTGDLYTHRPDDHLVFGGRIKDMLKVGGENVSALEVETFLHAHPQVRAAEVVGVPDDRLDEVPVAFVELQPGADVDPELLIAFCRGRIASYKVPRAVFSVGAGEWPMSSTKVDKRELRRLASERLGARAPQA
jgi:fatty-acyl-CoA synthase/long-chain acyl-CoA synthetase